MLLLRASCSDSFDCDIMGIPTENTAAFHLILLAITLLILLRLKTRRATHIYPTPAQRPRDRHSINKMTFCTRCTLLCVVRMQPPSH